MCESVPATSIPPLGKPQAFVARRVSGAGHLAVNSALARGHLQTTKNLLRKILSSFLMALRVKGFKHHHFGIRRAAIRRVLLLV